ESITVRLHDAILVHHALSVIGGDAPAVRGSPLGYCHSVLFRKFASLSLSFLNMLFRWVGREVGPIDNLARTSSVRITTCDPRPGPRSSRRHHASQTCRPACRFERLSGP